MKKVDYNLVIFIALVGVYIIGQALIGTYNPAEKEFVFDAPADSDFLYYGAIANTVLDHFPPDNPAFTGTKLTQPFLQYYPLAVLAKLVGPYNGIRILNIIYLLLFAYVLKKLFPKNYVWPLVLLFAGSSISTYINALGIDLISRGFTHAPFFILLTLALYAKSRRARLISLFVAALLNGYLMLIFLPFVLVWFIYKRDKEYLYLLGAGIIGMAVASLFVMSEAVEKPVYFIMAESFKFAPLEILKHALPIVFLAIIYRHLQMSILLAVSIIFGALIHYNPFFPVFMVYFSGAMIIADGKPSYDKSVVVSRVVVAAMFICFLVLTYVKFDPSNMDYYPRYDTRIDPAIEWIKENTLNDARFAAINADKTDLALLMQYRPLYLGPIELVAHLGLNWQPRYRALVDLYSRGQIPDGIDYIFYGPVERKYFPNAPLNSPAVYRDNYVTIFRANGL